MLKQAHCSVPPTINKRVLFGENIFIQILALQGASTQQQQSVFSVKVAGSGRKEGLDNKLKTQMEACSLTSANQCLLFLGFCVSLVASAVLFCLF